MTIEASLLHWSKAIPTTDLVCAIIIQCYQRITYAAKSSIVSTPRSSIMIIHCHHCNYFHLGYRGANVSNVNMTTKTSKRNLNTSIIDVSSFISDSSLVSISIQLLIIQTIQTLLYDGDSSKGNGHHCDTFMTIIAIMCIKVMVIRVLWITMETSNVDNV